MPFPAPVLLSPSDSALFTDQDEIVLSWQSVGQLAPTEYYVISVAYVHEGKTWYDETPWIKATSWTLSEHSYLPDLSDDDRFHWSVQVMRQTGVDVDGKPVGIARSPMSDTWILTWTMTAPPPPPSPITPTPPPPTP